MNTSIEKITPAPVANHTAKDDVLGMCRSMGPCTFNQLVCSVLDQVVGVSTKYQSQGLVVEAINALMKEGAIELYDTGDAWDVSSPSA